jgi:hypothetical protein
LSPWLCMVRERQAHANTFFLHHAISRVVGSVAYGSANRCGSTRSGSVRWLSCLQPGAAGFEERSDSSIAPAVSRTRPALDVGKVVWQVVVLAAIWAMEHGWKRNWTLVHMALRHGNAVRQGILRFHLILVCFACCVFAMKI